MDHNQSRPSELEPTPKKKSTLVADILDYIEIFVVAICIVITIFSFSGFRLCTVDGPSMENTLLHGERLITSGLFYTPERGDVVVFHQTSDTTSGYNKPIVKRVIATEGQWVSIDFTEGVVYVGDSLDTMKPLDEPYTLTPTNTSEGIAFPLQVSEGCLFVMGDNRNGSKDSRHPEIGLVDKREVLGKVVFLFVPGTNEGEEEQDFDRIGVVD